MLVDFLLHVLTVLARVFTFILPPSSFLPLPQGFLDALEFIGTMVASAANVLPDGTLNNLVSAMTVVLAVNFVVVPWLAARNFRLPFAALTKKE